MFVDLCIIVQFIQTNPTGCNSVSKFIILYLYEAQHVSGGTPPETCWASYKYGIINFDTLLILVGFFCMNYIKEVGIDGVFF
jgi:hypothetical protein